MRLTEAEGLTQKQDTQAKPHDTMDGSVGRNPRRGRGDTGRRSGGGDRQADSHAGRRLGGSRGAEVLASSTVIIARVGPGRRDLA